MDLVNWPVSKILLLVFPGFSEFEITVATTILSRRLEVQTVGLDREPVTGEGGLAVVPRSAVDCVDLDGCEGLIIPGAPDMSPILDREPPLDLIRKLHHREKVLAAICAGPILLARAGVLSGRPYTVGLYREFRDQLGCFDEAHFCYEPLVEAGNIVTAQGFAFVEFGLCLGRMLGTMHDPEGVRAFYTGSGYLDPTPFTS